MVKQRKASKMPILGSNNMCSMRKIPSIGRLSQRGNGMRNYLPIIMTFFAPNNDILPMLKMTLVLVYRFGSLQLRCANINKWVAQRLPRRLEDGILGEATGSSQY